MLKWKRVSFLWTFSLSLCIPLPLLTVPNPSTVFARRAFNYTAPTTWNSLPAVILTCDSESGFKRLLKTHLFNDCFNVAWLTHSQRLCSSAYGALQICLWYDMIWQPGWAGTRTHINPIYHTHCPPVFTSTPNLPSQASQFISRFDAKENPEKQLKEMWRTRGQEPHFFYTRLIMDLMRRLVNYWSALTHASYCMTTSRPAAATQMSDSKPSHARQSIFMPAALPVATLPILGLEKSMLACISWS